jgi:methanogenic corrinoid protein MtbC1
MRQLPIPQESWNDVDAIGLLRRMERRERAGARALGGKALAGADSATKFEAEPGLTRARHAALLRTVENEVIPRLIQARRSTPAAAGNPAIVPTARQVQALADLARAGSQSDVTMHLEGLCAAGMPAERLFLDLIPPAARRLGEMWDEDECDFSDVTMGVLRLSHAVQSLGQGMAQGQSGESAADAKAASILLAQAPGGQHGLGLAILAQLFHGAGWQVRSAASPSGAELLDLVRCDWFGVVGLSVACAEQITGLAATIRGLRTASCNPRLAIMVGGAAFAAEPGLAAEMGADATASDAETALAEAQRLLSRIARDR